jgi:hypothetical protein
MLWMMGGRNNKDNMSRYENRSFFLEKQKVMAVTVVRFSLYSGK